MSANNYSSRRKSSKTGSNGPNSRLSSYKGKPGKENYKTIEDPLMDNALQKAFNQNRISMDSQIPVRGNSSKSNHQRTKSDMQQPRKKIVTVGLAS